MFSRDKNPAAKEKYRKIKKDYDLDGWVLTEIDKEKVVLSLPGSEPKVLKLLKEKPKEITQTQEQQAGRNTSARGRMPPKSPPRRPIAEPEPNPETEDEPELDEPESEISDDEA